MTTLASLYCDACGAHSALSDTRALAQRTPGWTAHGHDFHACPRCAGLNEEAFLNRVRDRCVTPSARVKKLRRAHA